MGGEGKRMKYLVHSDLSGVILYFFHLHFLVERDDSLRKSEVFVPKEFASRNDAKVFELKNKFEKDQLKGC